MNVGNNPYSLEALKQFFLKKAAFPRLILINVIVFALGYLVHLVLWLFKMDEVGNLSFMARWFAVPSSITTLLTKPWTVITYMFLHEGFFHLFFNMITLYFGGTIFLMYLNNKQLLWNYLLGGLSGALFYIAAFNFFPVFLEANPFAIALGASASVLAVLIAIATYVPQLTVNLFFIGPVRLKYIAIFFIVIDIFSIQGDNPGGHIAHLGGAAWGFAYALLLRSGTDLLALKRRPHRMKKMKVNKNTSYRQHNNGRPLTDDEYNQKKQAEQQVIDGILDKISKSGYSSLSEKEKAILFKNSNNKS